MSRIQALPPALAQQIAAGEVIERPASVVKELLENAIDAGASDIQIELEGAGQQRIRITDNGQGIHPDDLELAFQLHTTSKIQSLEDLLQVQSHGFRGEALASIASVAKVTLTSKHHEYPQAYQFSPHLDKPPRPTAHPQGTTIDVVELFYNIPARKKFLKSERAERAHLDQIIKQLALAHTNVSFTVSHNGKRTARYTGSLEERLSTLLGEDFLHQAHAIHAERDGMKLIGYVGLPSFSHGQSDKQFLSINQRMIRDKNLQYAIKQAYQDQLHHGQHPVYALFLTLPAEEVDVNAHPSKLEVRLRQGRWVQDWLYHQVREALRTPIVEQFGSQIPTTTPLEPTHLPPSFKPTDTTSREQSALLSSRSPTFHSTYKTSALSRDTTRSSAHESDAYYRFAQNIPPAQAPLMTEPPLGYAIGSLHHIFILAQNQHGLVMVDTHAAHERILYEKLKQRFENRTLEQQTLLFPVSMPLSALMLETVQEHAELIAQLGISLQINAEALHILAVPSLLSAIPPSALVGQLLEELSQYERADSVQQHLHQLLSSIACHKALRAHDPQTLSEMNQLLRDLERTEAGGHCNHGRPTWCQLSLDEVGAFFMRGQ
ncbi:MAG: DNA mismatch repair endonuclease MutL [Cardiobacteriaceae bacterium]|nr:DNA mismatch repair endonuclease MutL [Cardiobacteriaceae bacterium]